MAKQSGASASAVTRRAPSTPRTPTTRLSGRRLLAARVAWGALAGLLLGLYALLLPTYWTQLRTVCAGAGCAVVQPTPASAQTLHQLGFSVAGYAAWTFGLTIASTLFCLLVGGVIAWRKSNDGMALVAALAEVALGTLYVTYALLSAGHSAWQGPVIALNVIGNAAQFLFLGLFPSGRFVPTWTRWLLVGWVVCGAAFLGARAFPRAYPLLNLAWFGAYTVLALAQIYRYRHVSSEAERQQTKWVVFGWLIGVAIALGVKVPDLLITSFGQPGSLYELVSGWGYLLAVCVVCGAVGMAILRSHLFDIDVIIRRTLVYSIITGTLATVYAVSTFVLQAAFEAITGQGNALAAVASTLAIAALFTPVRSRVKATVDRRFYRRKYDAARTVAAFSRTVQREVDLSQLSDQLLAVVEETMQPSQVSLWLVQSARPARPGDSNAGQHTDANAAEAARVPSPVPLTSAVVVPQNPSR